MLLPICSVGIHVLAFRSCDFKRFFNPLQRRCHETDPSQFIVNYQKRKRVRYTFHRSQPWEARNTNGTNGWQSRHSLRFADYLTYFSSCERDSCTLQEGDANFATTQWSVVLTAQGESPAAQEALEKLCRTYWRPFCLCAGEGIEEPMRGSHTGFLHCCGAP